MIAMPEKCTRVAAFFDIDGTLLPEPSLERRVLASLRHAGAISLQNYLRWLLRSIRLAPDGSSAIAFANKMHLRGLTPDSLRGIGASFRDASKEPMSPPFFPAALAQAAWHAELGHSLVLVSGTLAPLAHLVAAALAVRLAARNAVPHIAVCATRLEEIAGRYTGEIVGEALFGPAKARAMHQIAAAERLELQRCYAYANTHSDRWMLAAVGRPAVVNPTRELQRIARLNDWPILHWHATSGGTDRNALEARSRHTHETHPSRSLEPSLGGLAKSNFDPAVPQTESQS
jgi:HAD superfamily hydrolase (TIGR01490 family)